MILVLLLGFGISELIAPHKWHPVMVPRHKVQRLCFKYGTVPVSTDKCLAKQLIYTNPRHPRLPSTHVSLINIHDVCILLTNRIIVHSGHSSHITGWLRAIVISKQASMWHIYWLKQWGECLLYPSVIFLVLQIIHKHP